MGMRMAEPNVVQRDLQEKDHGPNGPNPKMRVRQTRKSVHHFIGATIDGGRTGIHMTDRQGRM